MTGSDQYFTKLKTRRLVFVVSAILVLLFSPAGQAQLYKWMDEDGNVNYSQLPPPAGIEGIIIEPPPAVQSDDARARLERRMDSLDRISKQRQEQATQQQEAEQERAEQQQRCQQARARLVSLQYPRIRATAADGSVRQMPEEQRQSELEKSRSQVNEICSGN